MTDRQTSPDDPPTDQTHSFLEEVEIRGHIIDSLVLPKVLDCITTSGGSFHIKHIEIGHDRTDPSEATIEVRAATREALQGILSRIADHGAVPTAGGDCELAAADRSGSFPEGFYSTTNQRTEVRIDGQWKPVELQEMDCGVQVDRQTDTARCVAMTEVEKGKSFVVGHRGVRAFPPERVEQDHAFAFMNSSVSTEKPKGALIREIARLLFNNRAGNGKTLLVGGPAIIHTGSGDLICELVRGGYIGKLFAGNALAAHDIEQSFYGTSLGVNIHQGSLVDAGHEHHLRSINRIRRAGSIAAAVEQGILTSGIMYECVRGGVEFQLAGSIRDDGPLPDVVTDALENQRRMRTAIRDISFCLMIATTLHSIAVGNLLPASVQVVCVDINPSTVIKLSDRGSFQTIGLVTDVEPFLTALVDEVRRLEAK